MKVYVAVREDYRMSSKILGVFLSKESAINKCLEQPTYTRTPWETDFDLVDCWHNGCGLYVKVISHEVCQ